MSQEFEPTILAFVCNWCTYTAADLAGTSRMVQQPNLRLVRMMCTGMVDPKYIVKSLLSGADGVLVSGCHPGDCHYINGNYKARRRVKLLNEILPQFGIEKERVKLTWVGASEGNEFAATVNNFINEIRELGPMEARSMAVV
ncbi:MAG: hydrogenase iron-sulfur subunit [Desulfovibrionaceae bacterium]|nr:hydrogenase iron-sulfur subunit [Desulfovibrionaceae bacterium]